MYIGILIITKTSEHFRESDHSSMLGMICYRSVRGEGGSFKFYLPATEHHPLLFDKYNVTAENYS